VTEELYNSSRLNPIDEEAYREQKYLLHMPEFEPEFIGMTYPGYEEINRARGQVDSKVGGSSKLHVSHFFLPCLSRLNLATCHVVTWKYIAFQSTLFRTKIHCIKRKEFNCSLFQNISKLYLCLQ
jgi:hypothetical protein